MTTKAPKPEGAAPTHRIPTNRELLEQNPPAYLLTGIEGQRLFLLRQFQVRQPCPACGEGFNRWEGAGVDLDDYDLHKGDTAEAACPHCACPVLYTLPLFGGGWHWRIDRSRASMMWAPHSKPKAFYALAPEGAAGPRLTAGPFAERNDAETYANAQRGGWTVEER